MVPSPRRVDRNLSFIVLNKLIATGFIPIAVTFLSRFVHDYECFIFLIDQKSNLDQKQNYWKVTTYLVNGNWVSYS